MVRGGEGSMTPPERLAVSTQGMRELHAGRAPWSLAKELIQNSWDESPETTVCTVEVKPLVKGRKEERSRTVITVTDDGPGFADIRDAYTLMGSTPKRGDPAKRGRFNVGEKEIISVATEATIATVGRTVVFPASGGREVKRNRRKRGTEVTVVMPWSVSKRQELVDMLRRFRPTDCRLVVNGDEVPRREPVVSRRATLTTVLQSGPGEPMRSTARQTVIDILEPLDGERWLYEMGIPIQPIDLAYDVDVQQKVPMPPNRDTVNKTYLRDISAEVLNATHPLLDDDDFADSWVRTAIEDERIEQAAVKTTVEKRYGDRVAMWSSYPDANMRAAESGYEILHPRSMSPEERTHMRDLGGLVSANDLFGNGAAAVPEPVQSNTVQRGFASWVVDLASRCGLEAKVAFIRAKTTVLADCTANSRTPTVRFNVYHLTDEWFARRGPDQLELVVHELAHAVSDKPMEHGPAWGEACCWIAGRLLDSGKTKPATEARERVLAETEERV